MDTYTDKIQADYQLQFWIEEKKQYVPMAECPVGNYKAWRKCKLARELKPAKYRKPTFTGSSRTITDVQREYCNWASQKGLPHIHAFKNKPVFLSTYQGTVTRLDADAYFTVEVSELETET